MISPEVREPSGAESTYLVMSAREALGNLAELVAGACEHYPADYVEMAVRAGIEQALPQHSGQAESTALLKRALWEALSR